MKLFLTSTGLSTKTAKDFLELLSKKPAETSVCVIITASLANHPKGDAPYVKADERRLAEIGFKTIIEVDLRKEKRELLEGKLKSFDVVFVEGGNTFYLMKYIRKSGFDKAIKRFLDDGGVYLGVSAGSYVACPDISPAQWKHADEQNKVGLKDLTGLGLVNFYVSPHYKPEHEKIISEKKDSISYPVFALTDAQAILVDDRGIRFIGPGEFKKFNQMQDERGLASLTRPTVK
jgi:dipeptidase E